MAQSVSCRSGLAISDWLFTPIQCSLCPVCLSEYHKMSCLSGQGGCHNTALKCPDMDQTLHRVTIGWDHWVWNAGLCACRYSGLMTCCNLLFVIPRSQSLTHFGHHTTTSMSGSESGQDVKRERRGGVTKQQSTFLWTASRLSSMQMLKLGWNYMFLLKNVNQLDNQIYNFHVTCNSPLATQKLVNFHLNPLLPCHDD